MDELSQLNVTHNTSITPLPPWHVPSNSITIFRVYYTLLIFFGSFGNIVTIIAIIRYKDLHSQANYYVLSLAVADLGVSIVITPAALVTLTHNVPDAMCKILAFLVFLFLHMSVVSLGSIAFNRYVLICRSFGVYTKLFTSRKVFITIVVQWIIQILFCALPLVGFGSYGFNPFTGICILTMENHYSVYFLVLSDIIVMYPSMILTLAFYIAVFKKFIQSQRSVHANISENKSSTKGQSYSTEPGHISFC